MPEIRKNMITNPLAPDDTLIPESATARAVNTTGNQMVIYDV